jgi:hypothetical protein
VEHGARVPPSNSSRADPPGVSPAGSYVGSYGDDKADGIRVC